MRYLMRFPIRCNRCGRLYTEPQWSRLELCGYQVDPVETLELRTCACGSTHSMPVERDEPSREASP